MILLSGFISRSSSRTMSILRKSSAVSRSSGFSNDNYQTDVLIDNLSKTFEKSICEVKVITPTHGRRTSEKKVIPTDIYELYAEDN
jgi:hypothetical protein